MQVNDNTPLGDLIHSRREQRKRSFVVTQETPLRVLRQRRIIPTRIETCVKHYYKDSIAEPTLGDAVNIPIIFYLTAQGMGKKTFKEWIKFLTNREF